jgi:microcystin-dependent protein
LHGDRNFYFADIKDGFKKYVMQIEADTGNVGIGTTTPGATLDVDGDVRASEFVSTDGAGMIPVGGIIMWHGAENKIPDGWALCNGNNETPNLTDKFIVGAGESYRVRDTGGKEEVTLAKNQMPKHNHIGTESYNQLVRYNKEGEKEAFDGNGSNNTNRFNLRWHASIVDAGESKPHENRPPYYALCFIMKVK